MEFISCFICFKKLEEPKQLATRTRASKSKSDLKNKKEKTDQSSLIKFLTKYLLTTKDDRYEDVVKNVLKFSGVDIDKEEEDVEEGKGSKSLGFLRLCEKCEVVAGGIQDVHLELERLQRKIMEEVESVKEAILKSSGWLGGIGKSGNEHGTEEAFENFSKRFCNFSGNGKDPVEAKEIFETLKAFQTAVRGKDNTANEGEGPDILEALGNEGSEITNAVVKVEPEEEAVVWMGRSDFDESGIPDRRMEEFIDDHSSSSDGGSESDADSDLNSTDDDDVIEEEEEEDVKPEIPLETTAASTSASSSSSSFNAPKSESKMTTTKVVQSECEGVVYQAIVTEGTGEMKGSTVQIQMVNNRAYDPLPTERPTRERYNQSNRQKRRRNKLAYTCETCGFSLKNKTRFEDHLREHETTKKSYQCGKCKMRFSNAQLCRHHFEGHTKVIHLKCDVCQIYFIKSELPSHLKTHVDEVFPCDHCDHCSSSLEKKMVHLWRNHGGLKEFKCEICGEIFEGKKKMDLMKHLNEVHQVIGKHKCDFEGCNKSYLRLDGLQRHKMIHSEHFRCPECSKIFESRNALEMHQRIHTGQKRFKCDQCSEGFSHRYHLEGHQIEEHGAPKFKCQICNKEYSRSSALYYHAKAEHGTGELCPVCNKKFFTTNTLKMHIETHSETENYVCEECGKSFRTRRGYQVHRRTHGEKNRQCPYCPKTFTSNPILKCHIRTHTGERPYQCEFCRKAFNQAGARNLHRKRCSQQKAN